MSDGIRNLTQEAEPAAPVIEDGVMAHDCICGREYVRTRELYDAHRETPPHRRWYIETIEAGRRMPEKWMYEELFGLTVSSENVPEVKG